MPNNSTDLVGFDNTQDLTLTSILLENFIMFYDWGFVNKGGFSNIPVSASGMYGGDKSKLAPVNDPNFTNGRVWQANRANWVWETGTYLGSPINISGVYVNNTLLTSGYNINYKDGRIVFDTAKSVTSNVKISYSSKYMNVVPARGIPWIRNIQQYSNRVDNEQFTFRGSGDWAILGQSRVQLPAIAIDVIPPKGTTPYQLGGGKWIHNDIIFYVIAAHDWQATNIMDQIVAQDDRNITLFDPNEAIRSGVYPFDGRGYLRDSALPSGMYPSLVRNFEYKDCFIHKTGRPQISQLNPDLYFGVIKCSTEVRDI
jgi:hypothetical protein